MKRLILIAAAAALLLVGCGGHSGSSSSVVSSQPATIQSATGSVAPLGWGRPAPASAHLFALAPRSTSGMFDTITLSTVPHDPFALAGYTAGFWPTFEPLRRAYPGAHVVSIAISARDHADCLDVEPGDATPSEVPGWVRADKRAGWLRPCVYSDWWEFHNEINPILARAGISAVWKWDADYTFVPHIDAGFQATQWTDRALGRNLDQSLVLRSFLSIAHPPLRAPAPKPKPSPSQRLRALDALLGAYSKRNPHGHNCQHPPYKHAYPSARYDHACEVWAQEAKHP